MPVDLVNETIHFMVPTYVRAPPVMVRGEGCYLWDLGRRRYLDLTAGIAVTGLGHSDAGVAHIISEQVPTSLVL